MEIPDQVLETILTNQTNLIQTIQEMNLTIERQMRLLESLLPKPFDYSLDQEPEEVLEPEEVDLFETIEYEPTEEIEEALTHEYVD